MRELHLFSGVGGGVLGGILLGHTCVCAVEIEPYRRKVLLQRQRDGILPRFPIWDDVRTFDAKKSALQAKEEDSWIPTITRPSNDWFVRFDHHDCSWKTPQCSLFEDWQDCLDFWPQSGTMQGGMCFPLDNSERPTIVPAFGFWLSTPCATEGKDIGKASILARLDRGGRVARNICGRHWLNRSDDPMVSLNPCFAEWMMDWPIGWTDLQPLEMARFQQWLNSHGKYYHNNEPKPMTLVERDRKLKCLEDLLEQPRDDQSAVAIVLFKIWHDALWEVSDDSFEDFLASEFEMTEADAFMSMKMAASAGLFAEYEAAKIEAEFERL